MTVEEKVQYDSILKGLSVEELKKAVINNLNSTSDLEQLARICMSAALTFSNKAKL